MASKWKRTLRGALEGTGVQAASVYRNALDKLGGDILLRTPIPIEDYCRELAILESCVHALDAVELDGSCDRVIEIAAVPFVKRLEAASREEGESVDVFLLQSLSSICQCILHAASIPARSKLLDRLVVQQLCAYHTQQREGTTYSAADGVDIDLVLRFLQQVLREIDPSLLEGTADSVLTLTTENVFNSVVSLLEALPMRLCHFACSAILPRFLKEGRRAGKRLTSLWSLVCKACSTGGDDSPECGSTNLAFTILCCLCQSFLAVDSFGITDPAHTESETRPLDIRASSEFWSILQNGLMGQDPLNRKRSMFLLHRCIESVEGGLVVSSPGSVFWWERGSQQELKQTWKDFFLLMDTLEEKQVHIVKPVMPRLANLIAATRRKVKEDHRLLHFSWLGVVFKRIFVHDAKVIIKWGVRSCLDMELEGSPILNRENWGFIFDPLFAVLSQSSVLGSTSRVSACGEPPAAEFPTHTAVPLYRDPDLPVGSCPRIVSSLKRWLPDFIEHLPTPELRRDFVVQFIKECKLQNPGDISLCFFSEALSLVSAQPLLGPEGIQALRVILSSSLLTHQIVLRSAIQCHLLRTAAKLSDLKVVGFNDIASLLGSLKSTESIAFNTTAWREAMDWVYAASKQCREDGRVSLHAFLLQQVALCLSSHGQQKAMPSSETLLALPHLARMALIATALAAQEPESVCVVASAAVTEEELVASMLKPVLEVIAQAGSRAYLSPVAIDNALCFLTSFLEDLRSEDRLAGAPPDCVTTGTLRRYMEPLLGEVLKYLLSQLHTGCRDPSPLDLASVKSLLSACDSVSWFLEGTASASLLLGELDGIIALAEDLVSRLDTSQPLQLSRELVGVVTLIGWVCRKHQVGRWRLSTLQVYSLCRVILKFPIHPNFTKPDPPPCHQPLARSDEPASSLTSLHAYAAPTSQGHLVSFVLTTLWQCHHFVLQQKREFGPRWSGPALPEASAMFEDFADCLDTAQADIDVLFKSLSCLVPEMVSLGLLRRILDLIASSWSLVLEICEHHKALWTAVRAYISFAMHPSLLMCSPHQMEEVLPVLKQVEKQLRTLGEIRFGHYNLLVSHCCTLWIKAVRTDHTSLENTRGSLLSYVDLVVEACLFGPIYKKNIRVLDDVEAYIASLGPCCAANQVNLIYRQSDANVRVQVTSFLFELLTFAQQNAQPWFLEDYLLTVVHSLLEKNLELSVQWPRYFINSLTHRVKTRLWQTMLSLVGFITEDTAAGLIPQLIEALSFDNQVSVKHGIEWTMTLLLAKCPQQSYRLLAILEYDEVKMRLACLPSFISIALHLFKCLQGREEQVAFSRSLLPLLHQWTQSHHFVARLYAQSALGSLWDAMAASEGLASVQGEFEVLAPAVAFMKKYGDAAKFPRRLQCNAFFSCIDVLRDWSVETIYYYFPLLSGVIDQELIAPSDFTAASPCWELQPVLPLCCLNEELPRMRKEIATQEVSDEDEELGRSETDGNVQKKITPWSGPEALVELFPDLNVVGGRDGTPDGLIVVASLVNKAANLGGLSRTCEIFGAAQLVIANKKVLEDPVFLSLSVTSEKWLSIREVRVADMSEYLIAAKQQGFTLIGVEQTANSKCLTEYKLPKRTVLVLGNEREGIPVELIHHVDDCVEIPQLGVVRSLNVHVSGAIAIWEYMKQHQRTN